MRLVTLFQMTLLIGLVNSAISAPLSPESAEYKQLVAMGYEFDPKFNESKVFSIASNGSDKLILDSNSERLAITSLFNVSRKLNSSERTEILEIINKINNDTSYQVVLGDKVLLVNVFYNGRYEAKSFARIIRLTENAEKIFNNYPRLAQLLAGEK